jgi:ribosomal protein S18 acetylase RimI-like enzyme
MTEQRTDGQIVTVRQVAAADWAQLRQARLAALADAPYAFSSTLAHERAYGEEIWRGRAAAGRTFGAFDGATITGLATGIPADEPAGAAGSSAAPGGDAPGSEPPVWELVGMWVAPAVRGQGVADRLVEAVCARARLAGAATVTLWVTEVNDRAIAFYRRLGFAPTGARQLVRPEEPDRFEQELALELR